MPVQRCRYSSQTSTGWTLFMFLIATVWYPPLTQTSVCVTAFTTSTQISSLGHSTHSNHPLESFSQPSRRPTSVQLGATTKLGELEQEAQDLLAKAKKLRQEIGASESGSSAKGRVVATTKPENSDNRNNVKMKQSEWSVNYESSPDTEASLDALQAQTYRLYLDVGREEGTWMDPRWGASERRIEGTLDICLSSTLASKEIAERMVMDNQMGPSSSTFELHAASKARLKSGFDQMIVMEEGGYRVDGSSSNARTSQTLRFYITVQGTQDGDVSIPEGRLYFSLPCFTSGNKIMLSNKEGIISVRQIGWHTGWRREESRILGVFRAVPIEKAQRLDGY